MSAPEENPALVCSACGAEMDADSVACFHCGHERRSLPVKKGQVVAGRYELMGILGRGGMGTVYEAHDRSLDEPVALKVLSETARGTADADRRFRAEIKLARKIRHPNVCGIHEYGEHEGVPYIVMELVKGRNLKKHLQALGRVSAREVVAIAQQIGEGLQAIHEAGVIHRDLKLSNVMMDTAGRVRLMDFGIAKGMGDAASTVTGQILGTPEYMSPEQIQAQPVDYRTDIYSLGVMTYELLTGRVPFRAATPLATIMLQVQEPPRLDDPAIPPALVPILGRALAKEPEDRYQSAREFVTALLGVAPSLESFAPASLSPTSEADISTMEMATPKFLIRPRNQERTASAQLASVGTGRSESPDRRRLWVGAVAATGLLATFVALRVAERGAAEPPAAQSTLETLPPPGAAAATGQARDEAGAAKPAPSQGHPPPSPRAERATVPAPSPPARAAVTAREEGAQRAGQARTGASPTSSRAATAPSIPRAAPSPSAAASTEARPAPPGATGRLQLGASPYAQVTVDGKDAGTLPLRPLELAPGPHVVRFAHPSYRPLERTVTIRAGETTKVFVNWSVDGIPR